MALEVELDTYRRNLEALLADVGKYVLIHKKDVIGVYDTYNDAIQNGYEKCGLEPFLVKQIEAIEKIQFFTRPIKPCHT